MFIEGGDIKMARTVLVKAYALFTSLSRGGRCCSISTTTGGNCRTA